MGKACIQQGARCDKRDLFAIVVTQVFRSLPVHLILVRNKVGSVSRLCQDALGNRLQTPQGREQGQALVVAAVSLRCCGRGRRGRRRVRVNAHADRTRSEEWCTI